jgi:hypothetical protein
MMAKTLHASLPFLNVKLGAYTRTVIFSLKSSSATFCQFALADDNGA